MEDRIGVHCAPVAESPSPPKAWNVQYLGLSDILWKEMKPFDELLADAELRAFEGWDFSYLECRLVEEPTPWNYRGIVEGLLSSVRSLLDLGTGGGEFLSSLRPLPASTFATEGYPPNVQVAKRKLHPLGVHVIETACDDNDKIPQEGALPLKDSSIDLVLDRHESFVAAEVFRVLRKSGRFITQQVGGTNYPELNSALEAEESPMSSRWGVREARRQLESAGLEVTDSREATLEARFSDIGAVVYYLKAVPWQVPGFTVEAYRNRLTELDRAIRRVGPFKVTFPRFLIQAVK